MAEDDVERLVAESLTFAEQYRFKDTRETRLARIVRELLVDHPIRKCAWLPEGTCFTRGETERYRCDNCAAWARLNRLARGEEA